MVMTCALGRPWPARARYCWTRPVPGAQEALSVLEEALAIQERLGEHVDVASTLVHLAACGNIRHYGRALSIYKRLSRAHPQASF